MPAIAYRPPHAAADGLLSLPCRVIVTSLFGNLVTASGDLYEFVKLYKGAALPKHNALAVAQEMAPITNRIRLRPGQWDMQKYTTEVAERLMERRVAAGRLAAVIMKMAGRMILHSLGRTWPNPHGRNHTIRGSEPKTLREHWRAKLPRACDASMLHELR